MRLLIKAFLFIVLLANCGVSYGFIDTARAFYELSKKIMDEACNAFDDDPNVVETWNGKTENKGLRNRNCPPYMKDGLGFRKGCLLQYPYPDRGIIWYDKQCAQAVAESSYFNPSIEVMRQVCDFKTCFVLSDVLNAGQCTLFPNPFGFVTRICARVALPERKINNEVFPADHNYVYNFHLNFEGASVPDLKIKMDNGELVAVHKPKICAYEDPSLVTLTSITDIADYNRFYQPFHASDKILPIVEKILKVFGIIIENGQTIYGFVNTIISSIIDITEDASPVGFILPGVGDGIKFLLDAIGYIIDKIGTGALYVAEKLGDLFKLNRVVEPYQFGCVEIPLGPMPPPYCPSLKPISTGARTQFICPKDQSSTANIQCAVSYTVVNNAIDNSIRVGFDNIIYKCPNNVPLNNPDWCVQFNNEHTLPMLASAGMRKSTLEHISYCKDQDTTLCVSNLALGKGKSFRLVFAKKIGNIKAISPYILDDMEICTANSGQCLSLLGVNTGDFRDITLSFPAIDDNATSNISAPNFNLFDNQGKIVGPFKTKITANNKICVTLGDEIIGCERRVEPKKLSLYLCSDANKFGMSCNDDYFNPKVVISLQDGASVTRRVISIDENFKLAGKDFKSFVTDEKYTQQPFSGINAINSGTIYGKYRNNVIPYDQNGNPSNENLPYMYGLEYYNGKYLRGGKEVCVSSYNSTSKVCPIDTKNCVLSKLKNTNIINCKDFYAKSKQYAGLRKCMSYEDKSNLVEKINESFMIYKTNSSYCYVTPKDEEVCSVSLLAEDRVNPAPNSLDPRLREDEFFLVDQEKNIGQYDANIHIVRDKTVAELGLCVKIPQPKCAAVTTPTKESGYATWTEAEVGSPSIGTCKPGMFKKNMGQQLLRYCVPNPKTKTFAFEPITDEMQCYTRE